MKVHKDDLRSVNLKASFLNVQGLPHRPLASILLYTHSSQAKRPSFLPTWVQDITIRWLKSLWECCLFLLIVYSYRKYSNILNTKRNNYSFSVRILSIFHIFPKKDDRFLIFCEALRLCVRYIKDDEPTRDRYDLYVDPWRADTGIGPYNFHNLLTDL